MGWNGRMCARVVAGSGSDPAGLVRSSCFKITADSLAVETA